ncbi:MAG: hypothetical protein K2K82_04810 [Muribaculaceae bacterium]|nr:hypothetical protein [Muribaculaceae bacterium]
MIFNFRVVSDEVENFRRDIQIDADSTFLDLRNAIYDSVNYDKNQMCSFFICDDNWMKDREITLEDMGLDASEDAYLMDETILSDEIEDEGARLMLTFDYLNDRSFYIEMKKSETGRTLSEPLCTSSMGTAPAQESVLEVPEALPDAKNAKAIEEFNEEFYGSDAYNDDEFTAGGFEEMTLDE